MPFLSRKFLVVERDTLHHNWRWSPDWSFEERDLGEQVVVRSHVRAHWLALKKNIIF